MSIFAPRVAWNCHACETPGVNTGIGDPFDSSTGRPALVAKSVTNT